MAVVLAALGADRLAVPTRAALEARFARAQERSRMVLGAEVIGVLVLGAYLLMRPPAMDGLTLWAALGGLGGLLIRLLMSQGRGTPLEKIKAESRMGEHGRDSIAAAVARVCGKLGLPSRSVRVFLTREKSHNASALTWSLFPGVGLHSSINLNRGVLHLLDGPELETVIGHELGHALVYVPSVSKWYGLHALLTVLLSVVVASLLGRWGVGVAAPLLAIYAMDFVIGWPWWGMSQAIELLCDDVGARVVGWLPAMSTELKLGVEQEAQSALMERVLAAHVAGSSVPLAKLIEQYEEALPFGRVDAEAMGKVVEQVAKSAGAREGGLSVRGFLDYLRGQDSSDVSDEAEELLVRLRLLHQLPRLELDRSPYMEGSAGWTEARARALVDAIRAAPDRLLFRSEVEILGGGASHPSTTRRLLYLWDNFAPR